MDGWLWLPKIIWQLNSLINVRLNQNKASLKQKPTLNADHFFYTWQCSHFQKNGIGAQDFALSTSSPYIYEHNRGVQQKISTTSVWDFLLNTSDFVNIIDQRRCSKRQTYPIKKVKHLCCEYKSKPEEEVFSFDGGWWCC